MAMDLFGLCGSVAASNPQALPAVVGPLNHVAKMGSWFVLDKRVETRSAALIQPQVDGKSTGI
ncbi:hypothetical protein E5D57_009069 [Metarhizium anisopliae]|nr:hypothetical protein E5D57_009069 [Metarhizium anisopliae]